MRKYIIEEQQQYVPITLDKLAEGYSVPFEVFTDDGDLKKSLFDKGFLFNVFAKEMIYRQGLTHFYIKTANNINFNEYLRHAEKLSRMVKDNNVLFIDYSEYKRNHFYIDKTLLSPLVEIPFEVGGMRYPVYGGIPLISKHLSEETIGYLHGLNADIVIRRQDAQKYENYLYDLIDAEKEICTERRLINIRQELLRLLYSKFLTNLKDEETYQCLLQETVDFVKLIIQFGQHPLFGLNDLFEIRNADSYVSVHSVNVCTFSVALGIKLGMDEKSLIGLGLAALLHDIGKVMISYAIVSKQGDMTIDEFKHYQTHVVEGANLIRTLRNVPPHLFKVVLQHHERLDGSGYPNNLSGKDIDVLSQIISVVDSYEILITSTPKRKGLSQEKTIEILRNDAENLHKINRTVYRALNSVLTE